LFRIRKTIEKQEREKEATRKRREDLPTTGEGGGGGTGRPGERGERRGTMPPRGEAGRRLLNRSANP